MQANPAFETDAVLRYKMSHKARIVYIENKTASLVQRGFGEAPAIRKMLQNPRAIVLHFDGRLVDTDKAMNEFTKREINEYLFLEFGIDEEREDESQVGDDWPFVLQHLGAIGPRGRTTEVYRFSDNGEGFFALAGPHSRSCPLTMLYFLGIERDGVYDSNRQRR